MKNNNRFSGN